jgi:hypothetical protein
MELTREMIEFIRQATWGEGRCQSAKLQEKGQEILRDIAKNLCRPTQRAADLCTDCETEVSEDDATCPNCGLRNPANR